MNAEEYNSQDRLLSSTPLPEGAIIEPQPGSEEIKPFSEDCVSSNIRGLTGEEPLQEYLNISPDVSEELFYDEKQHSIGDTGYNSTASKVTQPGVVQVAGTGHGRNDIIAPNKPPKSSTDAAGENYRVMANRDEMNFAPNQEQTDEEIPRKKQPPEQSRRESQRKNQNFQDVDETGRWGDLSTKEVVIAFVIIILVITGIFMSVIYFFVIKKDDSMVATPIVTDASSSSPSSSLTFRPDIPAQDQLTTILLNLKSNEVIGKIDLVEDINYYFNGTISSSSSPTLRAMAWILNDGREPAIDDPWLITRYVLAVFYYSLGG